MQQLVQQWFDCWQRGEPESLPITPTFCHTSPFGEIKGKEAYLALVNANRDKFLGQQFELHDEIYTPTHACVRYTATQQDFSLAVSEWYYPKNGLIDAVIAYYHIGEIRAERSLTDPSA